ncbi:transferase hexapeptide (six repeat-containing protein) [Methanobrevibacter gottschalkii]|uniref:Transferase hexapeptide (Six repeat-containing protein) n=1 Tax=Methanobrevibacter gottschalkii TaxID=190974 RepID=A0A1H7MX07_9EURY|nr:hypothetical protein [Methanobrevibacter gottschalkii]SEL15886.1 transferase hexapeptide (six repeat-containing protein) [Methanobrevibacter gottschalkii]
MELIKSMGDVENLKDNKIIGNPEFSNSVIIFKGKDNIVFCEGNVNLNNSNLSFEGSNSLIYLSSAQNNPYSLNLVIYNNSTFFIGRDNNIIPPIHINVQENQNVVIGGGGTISSSVKVRTSDIHAIYDNESKSRVNHAGSVFIGDHVCLGHLCYISRGVKIGSGAIVDNFSFVPHDTVVKSNSLVVGNPAHVEKDNVFFTTNYLNHYTPEDSLNSDFYKSNIFIYELTNQETLDLDKIDIILKNLDVYSRLEFVQKLFVNCKRKNRFTIK